MKKIKLASITILAVFLVTMQSCKKDEIEENNDVSKEITNQKQTRSSEQFEDINGISVKLDDSYNFGERTASKWLYFETRDDYMNAIDQLSLGADSAINSFETILSFSSMRVSKTENERESINIEDDLLATLLNNDGRIRIGEQIFQIDASNDTILVYNANATSRVRGFSTDDDVFDILDGIDTGDEYRGCSSKNKPKAYNFYGNNIKCKVVYQKAGIYFSLLSKISKEGTGGDIYLSLDCTGYNGTDNYYIKKNKPNIIYSIGSSHKYGNKQNYIYRAYQGCKRLINYHFLVYFNATNHNYPSNPPTLGPIALRIDCGQ